MKKIALLLSVFLLLMSCKNEVIEKPAKLIKEDDMVNIIYDLAILDAMRSQYPAAADTNPVNPREYIYKKYNIDSLQFVQSTHYYAGDIGHYRKMYEKVAHRIELEQKAADALARQQNGNKAPVPNAGDPDAPRVE